MTLKPGQYQIGDIVFGSSTLYPVENFEDSGYTANASDYAVPNTDEMRMGRDTISPGGITITMAALDNRPTEYAYDLAEDFAAEWRGDDVRRLWGTLKPLKCATEVGVFRIYGRPRKFVSGKASRKSEWIPIVCDFSRADTLHYDDEESITAVPLGSAGATTATVTRAGGRAPTWLRAFIAGPITNPKLKVGTYTVELTTTLASGKIIEINAYPWERRIINSDGQNLVVTLAGASPYMDEMKILPRVTTNLGLSGTGTSGATGASILLREAYYNL